MLKKDQLDYATGENEKRRRGPRTRCRIAQRRGRGEAGGSRAWLTKAQRGAFGAGGIKSPSRAGRRAENQKQGPVKGEIRSKRSGNLLSSRK